MGLSAPSTSKFAEPPLLNLAALVNGPGAQRPLHEQARGASPAQPRCARERTWGSALARSAEPLRPPSKLAHPDEVRSKSMAPLSSVFKPFLGASPAQPRCARALLSGLKRLRPAPRTASSAEPRSVPRNKNTWWSLTEAIFPTPGLRHAFFPASEASANWRLMLLRHRVDDRMKEMLHHPWIKPHGYPG